MRLITESQLYQISQEIGTHPSKIPGILKYLFQAYQNPDFTELSQQIIIQAAKISFDIAFIFFQQQQSLENLLLISPYTQKPVISQILFIIKFVQCKPEKIINYCLEILYNLTQKYTYVYQNKSIYTSCIDCINYSLKFKFCAANAFNVLKLITKEGLLTPELEQISMKFTKSHQQEVLSSVYQVLGEGAENSNFTRFAFQNRNKSYKSIRSGIQLQKILSESQNYDAEIKFDTKLPQESSSSELEFEETQKVGFKFQKQKELLTTNQRIFRKTKPIQTQNVQENIILDDRLSKQKRIRDMQIAGNYNNEFVDYMLQKIFQYQGQSLSQSALRQFLSLLQQVDPCLPVIQENLQQKTVYYMLNYLNENKQIITPWIKQLPFTNIHLTTEQFNQIQYCVKNSMLLQDSYYPELQNIYKSLKDKVMSYGLGE